MSGLESTLSHKCNMQGIYRTLGCLIMWRVLLVGQLWFVMCMILCIVSVDHSGLWYEDIEVQRFMWTKLNETMLKHMFPKPNFKGFMVDSAQANWNMVRIVYGLGEPSIGMVDKEHTCLFHWTQSLDKHTKQLIGPDLQNEHKAFCHQYKNAASFGITRNHDLFDRKIKPRTSHFDI